jgi:VWFA-related protein
VAIYPIDASGVAAPDIAGETSADTTGDFLAIGKLGDKSIDVKKDDQLKAAEQTEMTAIANATGGVANFNNDIAQALRVDFNQGQDYYTLSYTPSDANWNGAYRRISVNLKQQGYHLFYRRGYFSKSPPPEPSSTVDQFKMALRQGVPAVSGVLFSAKVTTSPDSVEVEYAIDQKTVQYQADPSGKLVANVDCAVLEYDTDGKVIGTSLIRITSKVDPEGRAQLETAPLIAKQSIPLKPGATSLTLGVRDQSNGRFGNREVSLASLQNSTIGITATQHASQPISSSASLPVSESPAAPKGLIHRTPEAAEQMQKAERRITLNVLVTEPSGKPVGGLQQQDFTVLDKARRQAITTFQAVDGFATTPPVELILLLDTMNASFEQVGLARQGMANFLRQNGGKLPVPVSIVFLSDAAVKLNQASRDGNALAADLEKLQSPMRVNDASKGFEGLLQRFQMSVHTLTQLSTYETTKPGRKMLLWIGPGWPILSSSAFHSTPQTQRAFFDSIVDLSGRLRKAQITLYSVVPLDLSQGTQLRTFIYQSYMGNVENAKQADSGNLAVQVLAYQSGGRALDPSGDLAGQISRCLDDAYIYYKISFDSDPGENGNEYHPLEIKLDRAGLKARTNTGYYAQP